MIYGKDSFESLGINEGITESNSYLHRLGVLRSISGLLNRSLWEVFFGGGDSAPLRAFRDGLVSGVAGIQNLDNQYLRTLTVGGIFGTSLLICVIFYALKRGSLFERSLMVYFCITFVTYEALTWNSLLYLFILLTAGIRNRDVGRGLLKDKGSEYSESKNELLPPQIYVDPSVSLELEGPGLTSSELGIQSSRRSALD
ncbi:hypothetical protein SAMN04489740_2009 [Arthrobacter alpinus]|uniref:Uncharacterized protein n=1 Tax=Arthrobacter alpinus TaxID=656366 RepID=A0A1H5KGV8_9MICC|nr:hypothetical protein SAMN04489740_2009 [Arthrobacter alpinus]